MSCYFDLKGVGIAMKLQLVSNATERVPILIAITDSYFHRIKKSDSLEMKLQKLQNN